MGDFAPFREFKFRVPAALATLTPDRASRNAKPAPGIRELDR
jgi:hypothetical protein